MHLPINSLSALMLALLPISDHRVEKVILLGCGSGRYDPAPR